MSKIPVADGNPSEPSCAPVKSSIVANRNRYCNCLYDMLNELLISIKSIGIIPIPINPYPCSLLKLYLQSPTSVKNSTHDLFQFQFTTGMKLAADLHHHFNLTPVLADAQIL